MEVLFSEGGDVFVDLCSLELSESSSSANSLKKAIGDISRGSFGQIDLQSSGGVGVSVELSTTISSQRGSYFRMRNVRDKPSRPRVPDITEASSDCCLLNFLNAGRIVT